MRVYLRSLHDDPTPGMVQAIAPLDEDLVIAERVDEDVGLAIAEGTEALESALRRAVIRGSRRSLERQRRALEAFCEPDGRMGR